MTEGQIVDAELEEEVFSFLDGLRESGAINMFGASPVIADFFDEIDQKAAKKLLVKWMKSFGRD